MKYIRLTKEQLEELHKEFGNFLASQSITKDEWEEMKANKPKMVEEELDLFSDLVWDGVLGKVKYLEHFSKQHIHLFKIGKAKMSLIAIKVENEAINLITKEGYQWLRGNLSTDDVNIYTSEKAITEDRNKDVFALIKQGANITKGELYGYFEEMV